MAPRGREEGTHIGPRMSVISYYACTTPPLPTTSPPPQSLSHPPIARLLAHPACVTVLTITWWSRNSDAAVTQQLRHVYTRTHSGAFQGCLARRF
ncbi:hypothetical protein E2C01_081008 [Portunus trituberculatus]|uniref:Uncharacterized protein n=1 Tax=Portunus trituberculatus TaxID=210409 RepID=A0A5B7IQU4_PORTR|nr:hypothetical protein [Portunus trituberculatus]